MTNGKKVEKDKALCKIQSGLSVLKKSVRVPSILVPVKHVRKKMNNYFDKYGRLHDKPCVDGEPSSNNGFIYSAYAKKGGIEINISPEFATICAVDFKRHPDSVKKNQIPMSRDEILGLSYLGYTSDMLISGGWCFSPFPIPKFNLKELVKQVLEIKGQHRNYFWKNGLSQIYRFAFSVPLQDRAFILECCGETKSLRYFFYKAIAVLDAKFAKPKNGIHWLKYGGEKRKEIMKQEFPEDHPLRSV